MGVRYKVIVGSAAAAALVIGLGMAPVPVLADDNSPLVAGYSEAPALTPSDSRSLESTWGEAAAASGPPRLPSSLGTAPTSDADSR